MKKLLFPEDLVMAGGVTPRTERCRADNLPSSAPHPPHALNTEVCGAAFILQLILKPLSAPPKSRDACEGLTPWQHVEYFHTGDLSSPSPPGQVGQVLLSPFHR